MGQTLKKPVQKYLIKYTQRSGEYEFSGHTIIELKLHQNIRAIKKFAKICLGVNKIHFSPISDADAKVLSRLNV